jgi:catalase
MARANEMISNLAIRLAMIGCALICTILIFGFVAGWWSPHRLTQDRLAAAFLQVNGPHPGFRLNHAKGVCVSGWFESTGEAVAVSKAAVFQSGKFPVVGRFSLAGGMPFQVDKPTAVRALALQFLPPGAQEWRTGTLNLPVFAVNSARGFYDQLLATAPDPKTGKPDPAKMTAFLAAHPETAKALSIIAKRTISSGFFDSTFNGLNAFRFVNAAGASVPVRWSFVPRTALPAEAMPQSTSADENYLFDALIAQINQHPLQWRLMITLGEPDDPTDDATLPWPNGRRQIDAGTVTIDQVASEDGSNCTGINFDPLVLPNGIESSDDPLLSARSAVYARSFTLRAGQVHEKPPSAVNPRAVQRSAGP